MTFASMIAEGEKCEKESYFTVKEIASSALLMLSNNQKIRHIAIKADRRKNGKAVAFLQHKVKGQKVFLKFDEEKFDEKNNLPCYL